MCIAQRIQQLPSSTTGAPGGGAGTTASSFTNYIIRSGSSSPAANGTSPNGSGSNSAELKTLAIKAATSLGDIVKAQHSNQQYFQQRNQQQDQQQDQQDNQNHDQHHHQYTTKKNHPRLIVHHDYRDHADDPPPEVDHYAALARSGANTAFPLKLYDMLDRVERDGYSHVVSWQPHGRCFVVHDAEEFRDTLPRYFKLSKVASFQRQLNLYGFTRLSSGADRNGYYHERFLRGKPFLIEHMSRAKVKGTCIRARANPLEEPNFWKMSWIGPDGTVIREASEAQEGDGEEEEEAPSEEGDQRRQQQRRRTRPAPSKATKSSSSQSSPQSKRRRMTTTPPMPPLVSVSRGSSSVVSHDDDEQQQQLQENHRQVKKDSMKMFEPFPITVVSSLPTSLPQPQAFPQPQQQPSSSAFTSVPRNFQQQQQVIMEEDRQNQDQQQDDDDDVMTGWGMKFHYLGPDSIVDTSTTKPEPPTTTSYTSTASFVSSCGSASNSNGGSGSNLVGSCVPPQPVVSASDAGLAGAGGGCGGEFKYDDFERFLNEMKF